MKKLYFLARIITLLMISLIFTGCLGDTPGKNIQEIQLTCGHFVNAPPTMTINDELATDNIKALINSAFTEEPVSNHVPSNDFIFDIIYKDNSSRHFIVDFDIINNIGYLTEGDITYPINIEITSGFIESTYFSNFFDIQFIQPDINLTINNEPMDYYYTSNFNYDSFNNTVTSNATDNLDDIPQLEDELYQLITYPSMISYNIDIAPTKIIQHTYANDELIDSFTSENGKILLPTEEGKYKISLECTWDKTLDETYYGTATYDFYIDLDLPAAFSILNDSVNQGDMFVVTATNVNKGQELSISSDLSDEIMFYELNGDYVAFMPVATVTEPTNYLIEAATVEPNYEDDTTASFEVSVIDKEFNIQNLTISSSSTSLVTSENVASDNAQYEKAYANPISEMLFDGLFVPPVEGIITTEFGTVRYTNGGSTPRYHLAIDIAAATGTPVQATNSGVVALSSELFIPGNVVIIDHGMKIYSVYYHLDERYVSDGDVVTKGDIIGTVGTTGYSTGPHLHFGVRQNGTPINPWTLYDYPLIEE